VSHDPSTAEKQHFDARISIFQLGSDGLGGGPSCIIVDLIEDVDDTRGWRGRAGQLGHRLRYRGRLQSGRGRKVEESAEELQSMNDIRGGRFSYCIDACHDEHE